ncbi:hypothetical protein FF1_009902 [Malus domestica]
MLLKRGMEIENGNAAGLTTPFAGQVRYENGVSACCPLQYLELQVLCLSSKVISSDLPDQLVSGIEGFQFLNSVEVLDLSFNLLNGTLPLDFGDENLCYLNLSYNKIFGKFPVGFTKRVSENSTIDLSFNKLDRIDTGLAASVQSENRSVCRKQTFAIGPEANTFGGANGNRNDRRHCHRKLGRNSCTRIGDSLGLPS